MSAFTESNTVEAYIRDRLAGPLGRGLPEVVRETGPDETPGGLGWYYISPADLPRQTQEVLAEPWVREALIKLNPEIADRPERADDVLHKLRAIILSVRADGLVKANEEFAAWL
ncbi:MAG: type I restriction endonuclease subunit R, partial [Acidobacteriota bacterium]|nr:type I restriction endonuclease subunit R [Acidobacteriota bacterium]